MWNNAVYLPENLMVYINFPKSIRNRGSFTIFAQFLQRVYFFFNLFIGPDVCRFCFLR